LGYIDFSELRKRQNEHDEQQEGFIANNAHSVVSIYHNPEVFPPLSSHNTLCSLNISFSSHCGCKGSTCKF